MFRRYVFVFVIFFVLFCAEGAQQAEARGAHRFGTPANAGFTGLWEYPTAEMPADGTGRFGATFGSPYSFYFVNLAWLPWLEINTRLTTFDNIHVDHLGHVNNVGRGRRYMDKAMDLKVLLYRSDRWFLPSLAIGFNDVMGTELMQSRYGVATWHINNFGFTLGYGTERMNGFFGGFSWNATPWMTLKAEYSPMNYSLDRAGAFRPHPHPARERYNVGVVLNAPWGTELSLSRQRGEEFVFSLSQRFDLTGTFLGGNRRNTAFERPGSTRPAHWRDIDPENLSNAIIDALSLHVRVRDVEVILIEDPRNDERRIYVAYENYGHSSQAEAMVRVLVVLSALAPHVDTVFLLPRVRGIPVVSAEFPGEILFRTRARDFTGTDLWQETRFTFAERNFLASLDDGFNLIFRSERALQDRARHNARAMLVYEPRINRRLNTAYESRLSVDFIYEYRSTGGWAGFAAVRVPIRNDIDIWWEPWMNDNIRLQRAVGSFMARTSNLWALGEAGWLDERYFGINSWGRVYSQDGRLWFGARLSAVRDRYPFAFAGLAEGQLQYGFGRDMTDMSPWRNAAWLQAGFSLPGLGLDVELDYGQFLDTDVGAKLSLLRRWDDVVVGFWISRTDRLAPTQGRNFTNAGVRLELPAERWFGRPSAHVWEQEFTLLSIWRADSGREPGAWRSPEHLLSQLRPMEMKNNVRNLLEEYGAFEADRTTEPRSYGLLNNLLRLR